MISSNFMRRAIFRPNAENKNPCKIQCILCVGNVKFNNLVCAFYSNGFGKNRIFLPKTEFQVNIKDDRQKVRCELLDSKGKFSEFYDWQLNSEERQNLPIFEIIDGPPYANGPVHVGHAINKLYKDFVVRSQIYMGKRVLFRAGWDCHGLPIELKAAKIFKYPPAPIEIRRAAHDFAARSIVSQMESFKQWGVTADWNFPYKTMDKKYVARQIRFFGRLLDKQVIYRAFRPVYWSPSSKTALAESELEHNIEHVSTAAFYRFLISNSKSICERCGFEPRNTTLYALIWTTAPWTLPLNNAIAYDPMEEYSVVRLDISELNTQSIYIMSQKSIANFESVTNLRTERILSLSHSDLCCLWYRSCMFPDIAQPFIDEDFVKSDQGTGLVHVAFAHGQDDYNAGRRRSHKLHCFVDENGCYTRQMGYDLSGKSVLGEGQEAVLNLLSSNIIFTYPYKHSYPYDWRTKKPVIIRSSEQWFIDIEQAVEKAVDIIERGSIPIGTPFRGLHGAYQGNVFGASLFLHFLLMREVCWLAVILLKKLQGKLIVMVQMFGGLLVRMNCYLRRHNFDHRLGKLFFQLKQKYGIYGTMNLKKADDIMDIWFDSGTCWSCSGPETRSADLVIEGIDQFRGWIQSLMLTSLAVQANAPFKRALIHNFAVDDKGKKMSKSVGNVVSPDTIVSGSQDTKALGIDGLRIWAALCCTTGDTARIGKTVINEISGKIKEVRLIMRYLLGCTHGIVSCSLPNEFHYIDKYILYETHSFVSRCKHNYGEHRFGTIVHEFLHFINRPLSTHYIHFIKDRLYCGVKKEREAVQYTLSNVGLNLVSIMAPILPHIAVEFFDHHPNISDPASALKSCWDLLYKGDIEDFKMLHNMFEKIGQLRKRLLQFAQSDFKLQGAKISCHVDDYEVLACLQIDRISFNSQLVEALNLSMVELVKSNMPTDIILVPSKGEYCERCRKKRRIGSGKYCERCSKALLELNS